MLDANGSPAHWLGEIYGGKQLREPINIVIIDSLALSADAATARLIEACSTAGYPVRMGHSSGYRAIIGVQVYEQIPSGWDAAFSDNLFELTNNHGRLFGPYKAGQSFVFIGAFSRERVSPFHWPEHRYDSFNRARDDFALKLDQKTEFQLIGQIDMDNAILDDAIVTTGDHDGKAALLRTDR
jgi:hypothetical protein